MRKNIFLALDFNSLSKALDITEKTRDYLRAREEKSFL